jgi:hypothetical protein
MKPTLLTLTIASLFGLASCASTAKPYPFDVCLVSGNKLGSMGKPVVFVHQGQEIKLCCRPCLDDFQANPNPYLAKLP